MFQDFALEWRPAVRTRFTENTKVLDIMEEISYLRAIVWIKLGYLRSLFEVTKWVKSMKYALFSFALGFLAAGLAPRPALAATSNPSFAVTVTVQAGCQVSAPATAFGIYTTAGANSTSAASVACTLPTPYNVSYSAGRTTGQPHAVFVQTAGAEFVAPGAYADTITATVTY